MKGLNKVQLIGNLGIDPETRVTPEGKKVTKFRMAVNRIFKNREGESIEDTQWFNIEAWAGLAMVVEEYLKSGDRVYIEGRLKTEAYEKDGETKYFTKVVVQELIMLGSPNGNGDVDEDEPSF
ncbi:MAG: single-stranded DNA-binding protein [Chloroflexota bacterium]|nr:MAG: single-stranded DNA-binding protein [Chloroflexota bacterium]